MNDNLFENQYNLTKKTKIREYYDKYKILIFSSFSILVIILIFLNFYTEKKKKDRVFLSESYIQAKIYIESDNKTKAKEILKDVIFSNDSTYSTLSLFLLMDQNLIKDKHELVKLFDHVLESLAKKITKTISIPTIGIGASKHCDGQILVTDDIIGMSNYYPKFVKK